MMFSPRVEFLFGARAAGIIKETVSWTVVADQGWPGTVDMK